MMHDLTFIFIRYAQMHDMNFGVIGGKYSRAQFDFFFRLMPAYDRYILYISVSFAPLRSISHDAYYISPC